VTIFLAIAAAATASGEPGASRQSARGVPIPATAQAAVFTVG
jgi:hypothetical protein